jgi:hypothetical protein
MVDYTPIMLKEKRGKLSGLGAFKEPMLEEVSLISTSVETLTSSSFSSFVIVCWIKFRAFSEKDSSPHHLCLIALKEPSV